MCEFCTKHGDGRIWFKNAVNYGEDLISDLKRRNYIKDFFSSTIDNGIVSLGRLELIYNKKKRLPRQLVNKMVTKAKEEHFGQVVTIDDIREIVDKAATIVRLPCACRWASTKKENRCCYSVSYTADVWYRDLDMSYFGLVPDEGLERISGEDALSQMEELENQGVIHTIWTMMTPFIGAICNCRPDDCLGLRTLSLDVETLFRGENVACVNEDKCDGCGLCLDACQFGAITGRQAGGEIKATVSLIECFGCGLCRNSCPNDSLAMVRRY